MKLIDHTHPKWSARHRRTNGAETYSVDLVKYQVPHWKSVLPENSIISTCPRFTTTGVKGNFDVAVQYLHTHPVKNPLGYVQRIYDDLPFKAGKLIFITAYQQYKRDLTAAGHNAVFIPMAIDVDRVRDREVNLHYNGDRIIWFGNIRKNKLSTFRKVQRAAKEAGYTLNYISKGKLNEKGKKLTQEEAWKIVNAHSYAVAVGRSALECYALGLKVIIAGRSVGGLVMSETDRVRQEATNFNGRYATYTARLNKCFQLVSKSQQIEPLDIKKMNHAEFIEI